MLAWSTTEYEVRAVAFDNRKLDSVQLTGVAGDKEGMIRVVCNV